MKREFTKNVERHMISHEAILALSRRAARNKSQRARFGPYEIRIIDAKEGKVEFIIQTDTPVEESKWTYDR